MVIEDKKESAMPVICQVVVSQVCSYPFLLWRNEYQRRKKTSAGYCSEMQLLTSSFFRSLLVELFYCDKTLNGVVPTVTPLALSRVAKRGSWW